MSLWSVYFFFFNDTATTEIYTLSLHDALPICRAPGSTPDRRTPTASCWAARSRRARGRPGTGSAPARGSPARPPAPPGTTRRSEEHTSELQSRQYLVCRLLLEKKKTHHKVTHL